jgi:hypothetical protein
MGLFEQEDPYNTPYSVVDSEKHRALAKQIALESFVLLQNRGHILPLDEAKKVAIVGPNADLESMQWGNYNGIGGQVYSKFDVQKNIWYNCGKDVIRRMAGGRFNGKNPMTFSMNTYFYDDADNSASESSYDNSGNILTSNPGFKDAATGNFTIYAGSDQAKEQTGDPRWLVEFDENLTGIDGINAAATLNGAVYTINGIKVREAGETLKGLSKGMYIINGKKYVVK